MPERLTRVDGTGEIADRIRARRGGRLRVLDQMLLHSPAVADGWNELLGAVRTKLGFPPALRELAILRIAVLNKADYEWQAHEPEARRAGVETSAIEAIRAELPEASALDARQQAVIAYTDAMTRTVTVPDPVFAALREYFFEAEILELTATIAAYNMVSRLLVALDVRAQAGESE